MTTKKGPRDLFGFDELPSSAIPDDVLAEDDRTLRLAAPFFTLDEVDQFIRYQETLRDRLMTSPIHADQWSQHLSAAHQDALAESGLSVARHAQISSVVSQFTTRRSSVRRLRAKQEEIRRCIAEAEAAGNDPLPEHLELDHRISSDLARLDSIAPLERRYGKDAIDALRAREDRLVELHSSVSKLLAHR